MNYAKAPFEPTVGDSYGNGWKMLWKKFLNLFLILIIVFLFAIPIQAFALIVNESFIEQNTILFMIPVMAYGLLLLAPLQYGVYYAYLKAARGQEVEIKDMFAFSRNYGNVLLAYILVYIIVGIGIVLLIIPGIIFACKLAFVPFLVVDKQIGAMDAIKASWRMTDGYAMNIFLIGLLAVFISIGGLIVFGIGIIIAIMWIYLAVASIYYAVDSKMTAAPVEAQQVDSGTTEER